VNLAANPDASPRSLVRAAGIGACLALSALALALAPTLMPEDYSWIAHTTSESAAQGISGAWLARGGFILFGIAVLALSTQFRGWPPAARFAHAAFGICMLAAATLSSRPWIEAAPYDATEDLLHSIAATAMGFAFAIGVAATAVHIWRRRRAMRPLDAIAIIASVALPLAMVATDAAGLLQRAMFLIAYAWYARETWCLAATDPRATEG
jgi:hypothetical protein